MNTASFFLDFLKTPWVGTEVSFELLCDLSGIKTRFFLLYWYSYITARIRCVCEAGKAN
jgi:hypothetical protein